jgi:putative membrane protein
MLLDNKIPIWYSLGKIKPELILVSLYSIGIVILDEVVHLSDISVPLAIPTLLGTAISLILGFRISQSYDRWWEARKIWGEIVNDSRSLVRQVQMFVKIPDKEEETLALQRKVAYIQIGFVHVLGDSLRGIDNFDVLYKLLSGEEIDFVMKQTNRPNAILQLHAGQLKNAVEKKWVDSFEMIRIDSTLTRLTDSMGKAERIKTTVFPVMYTLLVEFLLYLFVLLLPLGMTDYFGFWLAPLLVLMSVPFFLLEKTAISLQNPFNNNKTDIPVTRISKTIELNLREMIGEECDLDLTNPEDGSFFIM